MKNLSLIVACLIASLTTSRAGQEVNDVVMKVDGIEIPILIVTPKSGKGPFPVVYNVHGGGWNDGTETVVPPATVPPEAQLLSDELGIVYVGLAYRCKNQHGTFQLALDDLRASIKWFESKAATFKADISRVGLTGGSAGTPLSSMLAQEMPACRTYVGLFGVYDFTNNKESLFPDEEACKIYGLSTAEQKHDASAFYHLRKNPPATLLFHGGKDILVHSSQSIRFAQKIREAGGQAEATVFPDVNHGFFNVRNPVEYKTTAMAIAKLYTEKFALDPKGFAGLGAKLDTLLSGFFPVDAIDSQTLLGQWKSKRDSLNFLADGTGTVSSAKGAARPFTYRISGNIIEVSLGETKESFFMQRNTREIYKVVPEGRFAGNKESYMKQR